MQQYTSVPKMDLEGGLKSLSRQSSGKQHQEEESGHSCSAGQSAHLHALIRRAVPVILITASLFFVAALSVLGLLHANAGGAYGAGMYKRQYAGDDGSTNTNTGSDGQSGDDGGQGAFVEDNLYLCVGPCGSPLCSFYR